MKKGQEILAKTILFHMLQKKFFFCKTKSAKGVNTREFFKPGFLEPVTLISRITYRMIV